MGQRVVLTLTIYEEDGETVFDSFVKDSPNVDRAGVHAIQRAQLNAMSGLLDIAESVLKQKQQKAGAE